MAVWTVVLTRMMGGKPDSITRDNIVAQTQQEAIRKAQQGLPNIAQYSQITATQMGPTGEPAIDPSQQQQQPGMKPVPGMQMRSMESRHFPYTLSLPDSYASLLRETRIDGIDIQMVKRSGRVYLTTRRPQDLQIVLKRLFEAKDPRGQEIAQGIIRSL